MRAQVQHDQHRGRECGRQGRGELASAATPPADAPTTTRCSVEDMDGREVAQRVRREAWGRDMLQRVASERRTRIGD